MSCWRTRDGRACTHQTCVRPIEVSLDYDYMDARCVTHTLVVGRQGYVDGTICQNNHPIIEHAHVYEVLDDFS